jgi:hypothetical protein
VQQQGPALGAGDFEADRHQLLEESVEDHFAREGLPPP